MENSLRNIENRPTELYNLPFYETLPHTQIKIDLPSATGDLLALDVMSLSGVQPIEQRHLKATGGIIKDSPSKESIEIYKHEKVSFQIIFVVINCHSFREENGILVGEPYNISLQPATKRGRIETVTADWFEKMDIERLLDTPQIYRGFNPFVGAYGLYMLGTTDGPEIESDMLGFVHGFYALAVPFRHEEVLSPVAGDLENNRRASQEYIQFRNRRYFKAFKKAKPRRVWGCDSPIELFLLQAMDAIGLKPEIQTLIFDNGLTVPHFHSLWERQKSRKRLNIITEADFYFPEQKIAVFCDSAAHHSSEQAQQKDKAITGKLHELGIHSLRISGPEIAKSPFSCAHEVLDTVERLS